MNLIHRHVVSVFVMLIQLNRVQMAVLEINRLVSAFMSLQRVMIVNNLVLVREIQCGLVIQIVDVFVMLIHFHLVLFTSIEILKLAHALWSIVILIGRFVIQIRD